jgi:hypothetical protein
MMRTNGATVRSIESWIQFAGGAVLFVIVAAGMDAFVNPAKAALGARVGGSLWFGVQLLALTVAGSGLLWLLVTLFKGKDDAPDFRDFLLWNACVLGALVILLRMVAQA